LNVHRESDIRHIEIHRAKPRPFEVEIAIADLKKYKISDKSKYQIVIKFQQNC
jgi:hypothetical protein